MKHEAVKLVLWPRKLVQHHDQTVYRYVVVGMVCTSKPLDWPNESIVLEEYDSTVFTDLLDGMEKVEPDYPLGDAISALLKVVEYESS